MPVGFSSAARNLFLLGSSGAQVISNFFKTIDQSAGTDGVYLPDEIKYIDSSKKYALSGTAEDSNTKSFGWFERQDYDLETGTLTTDYSKRIESTEPGVNTTLRAMELDANDNLIAVGFSGAAPWIAKYSNDGVLDWQSTTNSANVRYLGVTSDSNGNYYACGRTSLSASDTQAFVEKFDSNGNPGWGKSAFMLGRDVVLEKISANDRGEVVAVGYLEDDSAYKGYIIKIDANTGEVLWDRTLRSYAEDAAFGYSPVFCEGVFVDSRDQIYVVGRLFGVSETRGFIVKYTPEGNIIWQKETPVGENIEYYEVKSDGETEQTIVFGRYIDSFGNTGGILSKYSRDGELVWRRTMFSSYNNSNSFGQAGGTGICLDADPSFYYFLYIDDTISSLNGTPETYTFGKVSSSGNGLGAFEYEEGTGETIDYEIFAISDVIGRLSDGSVRQDTSDLITYPFNANKILFDDLATQVSNKKRQMDDADSFEYSGSPAIRVADFQELNLLGENVELGDDIVLNGRLGIDARGTNINAYEDWNFVDATGSNSGYAQEGSNGRALRVTNTTTAQGYAWQEIPAEIGRQYTVSISVANISGQQNCRLQVGTAHGLGDYIDVSLDYTGPATVRDYFTFVPTTGNTFITMKVDSSTSGDFTVIGEVHARLNNWRDSSKNGYLASAFGAAHNAAGYWEFGGTDHKISVPYNDAWTLPGDFTLEAWIYRDSAFNANWWQDSIMGHGDGSGNNNKWIFSHNGTSLFFHTNTTAGSAQNIQAPTGWVPTNSEWYNVVVTRSGNTYTFYQNSTSLGSVTNSAAIPVASAPLIIGNAEGGGLFDGRFGEVRFYPRALTAAAVFQNYNSTKSKYIDERPDTAPKISDSAIVYDSNLLLNYDFGNRATYDTKLWDRDVNGTDGMVSTYNSVIGVGNDRGLGNSVDVGSGKIVAGETSDDDAAFNAGQITICDLDGSNVIRVEASDAASSQQFGKVVRIYNNNIYVSKNSGAATTIYRYDMNGTNETTITLPSTASMTAGWFDIDKDNGKIVCGDSTYGSKIHVFNLDGTGNVDISLPSDADDPFIHAIGHGKVAVGDTGWSQVVDSGPGQTSGGDYEGRVYVYDQDGTNEIILRAWDVDEALANYPDYDTPNGYYGYGRHYTEFGSAVAIGKDIIVVGCKLDFDNGLWAGAIYIFDHNGNPIKKVIGSTVYGGDNVSTYNGSYFGDVVRITDDRIYVTANLHNDLTPDATTNGPGAVFVFDHQGNELGIMNPPTPWGAGTDWPNNSYYGGTLNEGVAIGENKVVIGSRYSHPTGGNAHGAINIYDLKYPLPTTVKNLSSSSYTGELKGAVIIGGGFSYPTFNQDGYFVFDNADNQEIITSQTTVADTGMPGLTVEVWANLSSSTVFGSGGQAWMIGEEGRWRMTYDDAFTDGGFYFACATTNNGWFTSGTSIFNYAPSYMFDDWHHFVGVYDGSNLRMYYDGSAGNLNATTISGNVLSSGDPVLSLMGTDAANVGWGSGSIGQVRIYNRGLSATEVSQNYNATRGKYGV